MIPIAPVGGLATSLASTASSAGSRMASPFANVLGKATAQSGQQASNPAAVVAPNAPATQQQQANNALAAFRQQFQSLLAANNISTSQPIQLMSDGHGGIDIAPGAPNASQIKSLLQNHPEITSQFASLSQTFLSLRAADPTQAASAQNILNVTLSGSQATVSFS